MTQIGSVYGQALYSLAREENCSETILGELSVLDRSFGQEPDFLRLMSAPNLSKEERCGILDGSFRGKVHPYVLNFLKILTEKGYVRHFSDCCQAYRLRYNQANNILPVTAVTALALSVVQKSRLQAKLQEQTGKTVDLTNRIDPDILGGIRLDYDGKRLDGTVQNHLDSIRELLKNTVL